MRHRRCTNETHSSCDTRSFGHAYGRYAGHCDKRAVTDRHHHRKWFRAVLPILVFISAGVRGPACFWVRLCRYVCAELRLRVRLRCFWLLHAELPLLSPLRVGLSRLGMVIPATLPT